MADALALWTTCCASIRDQVSTGVWQSTFAQARGRAFDGHRFVLAVPSSLVKDRIEGRYRSLVTDALDRAGAPHVDLQIVIDQPAELFPEDDYLLGDDTEASPAAAPAPAETPRELADVALPDGGPDPTIRGYTFDDFVIGTSNRFAHAAALSVAETPSRSYNPLFIYGDAGLGKTHLLQAVKAYVRDHYPKFSVRYVSTETMLNEFVDAIRTNNQTAFKKRYREIDVLLLDDIQFIEGKERLQEEFFHTFNTLHQADRQIVLSSDRPPDAIPTLEDRLRSRFKMGLIVDIQPPDVETRLAILRKKGEKEALPIADDIFQFIAQRVTNNIRELEGALTRVTAYASLTREPCTLALAEQVLGDLVGDDTPKKVTIDDIIALASEIYGFSVEELKGSSRRRPLVTARQVAMYVTREITDLSFPAIAREFGGRDHTTVIHAVDKIKGQMSERRQIYDQVTSMIDQLKNGG